MAGPVSVATQADPAPEVPEGAAFSRLWRAFCTARLGVGLVLLLSALASLNDRPRPALLTGAAVYGALALAARWRTDRPARLLDARWLATVGVDLLAVSLLQLALPDLNVTPLLAIPVLMAATLGPGSLAIGAACVAAALLVAQSVLLPVEAGEPARHWLQAALAGAAFPALAWLTHQLALRLRREEFRSRRSDDAARLQAQVNELVIQSLAGGILVVDARGWVQAANPTACGLLGRADAQPGFALDADPAWQGLRALALEAIAGVPQPLRTLALHRAGQPPRQLQVRTRLAASGPADAPLCVLFLEDVRDIEARLRTEKLAAMGRMSAAVAHEIRNPLAAISQANALLAEELQDPGQRQLAALVDQNAQRLARIVDDVLDVARARGGVARSPSALPLDDAVAAASRDWQQGAAGAGLQLALRAGAARVAFEPDHLQRILVNLLDNALRHAGDAPGAIQVATRAAAGEATLEVWSEGPPLEPAVQAHLFEPFFSSESRSSGLGLFICRELCERQGARITYRRGAAPLDGARQGNAFVVHFDPPAGAATIGA